MGFFKNYYSLGLEGPAQAHMLEQLAPRRYWGIEPLWALGQLEGWSLRVTAQLSFGASSLLPQQSRCSPEPPHAAPTTEPLVITSQP